MVRFYRSSARYRRRYNRYRRYRRWYRRRYRRFVNSSSKSRVRVKIPVAFNVQLTVAANETQSNVLTVTPFWNNRTHASGLSTVACRGGLLASDLFKRYAALYDSFKLDGMKCAISITSPVGSGQGAFPALSVYTSWDRNFQYGDFDTVAHYPTLDEMKKQSSFLAATALNNSITKLVRSCYASDLFEKSSFIDCDNVRLLLAIGGVANQSTDAFATAGDTSTIQSVKTPSFCPALCFGVDTGSSVDAVDDRPCNLIVETMYYVTFRNPKYGGSAAGAKIEGVPRSVTFGDGDGMDEDDGDMDQGDILDEFASAPRAAAASDMDVVAPAPLSRRQLSAASEATHASAAPTTKTRRKNQ